MYIYHPNTKMTHKNDGFIENLMKVPAPLKDLKILAFKKLVIQRILLLMFKHNIGIMPKPIASLFAKKVKFIIIILDIVARFIQQLVNLKQHIELLVIMQF